MNRILLCIDGSGYSDVCCRYTAWLARNTDARIHALYVSDLRQYEVPMIADLGGSLGAQPYAGLVGQLTEIEEEKASLLKQAAERIFDEENLSKRFTFEHRTGLLVDSVEEILEDKPSDLIVLGKRGENANFATGHLGSAMERVVRASDLPCFVSSREFHPIEKILVSYDGSAAGRKAIEWLAISPIFKHKEIHVVIVNEGNREDAYSEHLHTAAAVLKSSGYEPITQMLTGDVEREIASYVSAEKIDMLVMGAYGHSRLRELFIGSTTSTLLRECHVPVMMFR